MLDRPVHLHRLDLDLLTRNLDLPAQILEQSDDEACSYSLGEEKNGLMLPKVGVASETSIRTVEKNWSGGAANREQSMLVSQEGFTEEPKATDPLEARARSRG